MKPLTIEELKKLQVGDWVWVTDENGHLGTYLIKTEPPYEDDNDKTFNFNSLSFADTYPYSLYGKTWLAWKNKEQAEAKGEIVELPCELGQLIYAIEDNCIHEYYASEINVCEDGRFVFETPQLFPNRLTFGEKVFTDKSEAERRLAELKGDPQ